MTPRAKAAIQARILDRIKATTPEDPPTDMEIAAVAGVDRSMVSKWRAGSHEMGLNEILNFTAAYGRDVVLQPIEDAAGVERPSAGGPDLRVLAGRAVLGAAEFNVQVQAALVDGRLTDEEAADLQRRADQLGAELLRMRERAVPGRCA